MRAADTNVLVRLLIEDDPAQAAAAERFVEKGVWVPLLALAEVVWVLMSYYGVSRGSLAISLDRMLHNEQLVLQDSDVVSAALELFRTRPGVDFSDCLILESARKAGHLPLGTFDRALGRMPGAEKL